MGRELRRKEEKRNKNKKNIQNQEDVGLEISGLTVLKVVGAVTLIILVVYFVLAIFVTKEISTSSNENTSEATSSETESVSDKVVAANIFNQSEDTYYVYCYDFNDEDDGLKQAFGSVNNTKVYRLDTSNSFNSKYVTDGAGNRNATNLESLKISNPTLLVISGDSIRGYYEGRVEIIKFLGEQ